MKSWKWVCIEGRGHLHKYQALLQLSQTTPYHSWLRHPPAPSSPPSFYAYIHAMQKNTLQVHVPNGHNKAKERGWFVHNAYIPLQ